MFVFLNLDHNNIDEDGASLLSELLVKLPYLESLSLSHNPIKDIGLYYLLKVILNKHRKVYDTLLSPDSFNYDDNNISNNDSNNEKKFFQKSAATVVLVNLKKITGKSKLPFPYRTLSMF